MTEFCDIQQLVKLFNTKQDDGHSDSDNDLTEEPANDKVSEEKPKETKANPYAKINPEHNEREVVDYIEEILDTNRDEVSSDWKKTPKWNITYRQKVTASDVFLQMGGKTPATSSCEDMIVTIDLPGEHMQNMDIKVFKNNLQVTSPNFSLKIPLPHPVYTQKGDAKWDKNLEKLTVTLTMEREFDFINF